MDNSDSKNLKNQYVNIFNREKIEINGVIEVLSSTEKEVIAKLEDSYLQIIGEHLKITKLIPDNKLLSVGGLINGLSYMTKNTKKTFLKKVFK